MSKKYRLDNRTQKKFAKDIKQSSKIELDIAIRVCKYIKELTNRWPTLKPNGTDFTGKYTEKTNKNPDFLIDGQETDITRSSKICEKAFHQKKYKVDSLIKNGGVLIFVNGYNLKEPKFLWLDSRDLKSFTNKALKKYGIVGHPSNNGYLAYKESYKYDIDMFDGYWFELPLLNAKIPKQYQILLEQTNT